MNSTGSEEWKPVVGYEDRYAVSNHGRVMITWSHRKADIGRCMKHTISQDGYPQLVLYGSSPRKKPWKVHKLVMLAFVGPPPPLLQINHKDGVKTNNRLDNLEYVTNSDNQRHAFRMGLHKPRQGSENFSHDDIRIIRARIANGETQKGVARDYGVSGHAIGCIAHYRTWKHVSFLPSLEPLEIT